MRELGRRGYRRKLYIVSAGNITLVLTLFYIPQGMNPDAGEYIAKLGLYTIVGVFYSNVLKMSADKVSTELKSLTND